MPGDDTGAGEGPDDDDGGSLLDAEFAALDAVLARSDAAIEQARLPARAGASEKDPLVHVLDWDLPTSGAPVII